MLTARRYRHGGRIVEAMRFVANGPDVAMWAGWACVAVGEGLSGALVLERRPVEVGDWIVKDGARRGVVAQEVFAVRYHEVRDAHVN